MHLDFDTVNLRSTFEYCSVTTEDVQLSSTWFKC